ncbi:MAG: hypothetical protein ACNS62_02845 [Candidatus Cyclobacteriaceae bacterium M3_2C_046]
MERKILNNNERSFSISGNKGKTAVFINKIASADDLSFFSYGQSLALKVSKDGESNSTYISKYQMEDDAGRVAKINETYQEFNDLIIEVYADNPLLSADLNFNVIIDYEVKPI